MLLSAYDFLRRHKRKFFYASAITSAIVITGKVVEFKFKNWQQNETQDMIERTRRRHHYDNTERTGNFTLQSLFPNLKKSIEGYLNSEQIVEMIRNNPEDKIRLWNDLKCLAFAKCLGYLYGGICLTLLMRVQLNILGGYLYQETGWESNLGKVKLSQKVQERFLLFNQSFISEGLKTLCQFIKDKTNEIVSKLSLKQELNLVQIEQLFRQIMLTSDFNISKLLLNQSIETKDMEIQDKKLYADVNMALEDVLGHSDVKKVIADCSNVGLGVILDILDCSMDTKASSNVRYPLAKWIPIMNNCFQNSTLKGNDILCQCLCANHSLNKFSGNIYEAFCQT